MTNARALIVSCKSCRPLFELLETGSYRTVKALQAESKLDRSTVDSHLKVLRTANVVRDAPLSLNPEPTWDTSVLEDHARRKGVARKTTRSLSSRQDLALADLWTTRAIDRLESQFRGSEFLPREPAMEKEANELRAKVVEKILVDTRSNLEGVRPLLPPSKWAEEMFPLFFYQEDRVVPDITQVMDWLQEIKAIFDAATS